MNPVGFFFLYVVVDDFFPFVVYFLTRYIYYVSERMRCVCSVSLSDSVVRESPHSRSLRARLLFKDSFFSSTLFLLTFLLHSP